jgi:tetrahydromethanopterin S-methyltransferase subunit G
MATRESLQPAVELQEADIQEISQARLERVEAELDRIEAGIAVREGLA